MTPRLFADDNLILAKDSQILTENNQILTEANQILAEENQTFAKDNKSFVDNDRIWGQLDFLLSSAIIESLSQPTNVLDLILSTEKQMMPIYIPHYFLTRSPCEQIGLRD